MYEGSVLPARRAPRTGVGPSKLGSAGGDPRALPPNAFIEVNNGHLKAATPGTTGSSLPTNACTFEQANDGQLDAARDYIRFGLMTFDNDPDPGIGVGIALPPSGITDSTNPFLGQWSYVKSASNNLVSSTGTTLGFGLPAGCTTNPVPPFEVGARHSAAPPWEGRMVPFPPANGDTFDIEATNDAIQKVLLSSRPYGATPIEGMLEDARDYYWYNPKVPTGRFPTRMSPSAAATSTSSSSRTAHPTSTSGRAARAPVVSARSTRRRRSPRTCRARRRSTRR